eukprot:1828154-Pyramimonas_sp.AAC.1
MGPTKPLSSARLPHQRCTARSGMCSAAYLNLALPNGESAASESNPLAPCKRPHDVEGNPSLVSLLDQLVLRL